ncbi:MAG: 5-(carboxyamino)imidazole ribonucleotide synthase [Verrucomicrobiota bacterium]|nr:5-(carboxyamino)imidazole ribonucleotide synthase [Verrucomicrobiota bacterium]
MSNPRTFLPGSTIGVMGGGQLGRMFAIAARRMGYRVHTFSPDEDSPTGQLADVEIAAAYEDESAVSRFAREIDVLTFEFENIPARTVEWCARFCEVRPAASVLHIAQHRLREKEFLAGAGLPLAPFAPVTNEAELREAATRIGLPAVLKTAAFGYDGKGQRTLQRRDDLTEVWKPLIGQTAVVEGFIEFERELSVIVARGIDGAMAAFPVGRNDHVNHILDVTVVPFDDEKIEAAARELAFAVAENIDLVGLLAVEMFARPSGEILINEIAPRPHNSGHWSFDAAVTSQFEQQLRAVCGLPLGSTEILRPAAMANLLGDLWRKGEPDWAAAAAFPEVKIHLYGKAEARAGRKMGHLVAFGATLREAEARVRAARQALAPDSI